MLKAFACSIIFVFLSLISYAEVSKEEIISKLRARRECCIQDISVTTWKKNVFVVVTSRAMGHDYCDSNYVFVSDDDGNSFTKRRIAQADSGFWLSEISFSSETQILLVRQGQNCFQSRDFGETFAESACLE